MEEELNSLKSLKAHTDGVLLERNKTVEELKEEVGRRKDSEENLRLEIAHLKEKLKEGILDENLKLKEEVKRLENELRLQRDRTATDEVVVLRNELRLAMEAEENSKQAMDEFALVIKEVAAEANQAKAKLASAEDQIRILKEESQNGALDEANKENEKLQNTIDRLRAEAEESLLAWNDEAMEFVKCLKEEEDEKAKLQEDNHKLLQSLTDLEQESSKIKEDTEKLRDLLKESFDDAELAKAESSELMDCLVENERRLAIFTLENQRLRVYESNINEKRQIPSSPKQELISHDAEEEKLTCSKKPHEAEEEQSKEQKSHSHGVEEKEQKKSAHSSVKKESKSHGGGEEKEQKRLLSSFSKRTKKETRIPSSGVEEKEQKRIKKVSHGAEEKEHKRIKKDSSLDKELKGSNAHAKTYGVICFDPMAMLPIPGISSNKHKEAGDSNHEDDNLTDSIFDLVESPQRPHRHRQHWRTTSLVEDEKSISSEEFEHEKRPQLDDMEVERAGAHSTKKGVLLRKFGDLWKRKNQGHSQNHHNSQNQDL